jgi:hypothetical protein
LFFVITANGKGLAAVWEFKNLSLANFPLLIKDNGFKTFLKAHIAANHC